jgi:hypothetical protein
MPEKATERERIEWHVEHSKLCGCRPVPEGLVGKLKEAEKMKGKVGLAKGKE